MDPKNVQDQLEMEQMAEAELARLQRQYRIMEGDRRAFLDDIHLKLSKQRKIIERLQQEKQHLEDDIQTATCEAQKRKDIAFGTQVTLLLERSDRIVKRISREKQQLQEINEQIKKTEKEVHRLEMKEITEVEYQERIKSGKNSIKAHENKLETTIKRFCSVLSENQKMREHIDHHLKERIRLNAIWEQLLNDFNNGKKFMMDLIEQATLAYDQREEACNKLQALKVRAYNDTILHNQEMKEMQRQLDHDGKLREFLTIKGQKRIMRDLEAKELKKHEIEREAEEKQLENYQQILEEIKLFCAETDVEKIVQKYVKQEEENFALFNYVNETSHEVEKLNESIKDIQKLIEEQIELKEMREEQQVESEEALKIELEKAKQNADADEKLLKQCEANIQKIMEIVLDIFNLVTCECAPVLNLLGVDPKIDEDNVFIYLGLIEKKISTIVTDLYFKEKALLKSRKRH